MSSSTTDARVLKENRNPAVTMADKECTSSVQLAVTKEFEETPSSTGDVKMETQHTYDTVSSTVDFQNVKENDTSPAQFPESSAPEIRTPDPVENQSIADSVNNVNNHIKTVNDKKSQVLKEKMTDNNIMCDNSLYDRGDYSEELLDRLMDEKEKENFFIKFISNYDKKDYTFEKSKNLVWCKFNSRQFIQEYGDLYIVFSEKILNHPTFKKQTDHQTPSDENFVNDQHSPPEKQLNGTLSPLPISNDSDCEGSKEVSLLNNVNLVNGYDKVWTDKNETDKENGGSEKIKSRKGNDSESPNETGGSNDITEENNQGRGGSDGDGNGEPSKNLEFFSKGDGASTLRGKLDAAHWEILPGYLKSAILKSREEFTRNLETEVQFKKTFKVIFLVLNHR